MLLFSLPIPSIAVVNQYYEAEVVSEYVIKGNTAVLKCTIPSFVADFVKVEAWVSDEGSEFLPDNTFGIKKERFVMFIKVGLQIIPALEILILTFLFD